MNAPGNTEGMSGLSYACPFSDPGKDPSEKIGMGFVYVCEAV